MEEESTKPYVYYERILNGISEIPESIKQKLEHIILIKNENKRIEEEQQQKEAKEKRIEEEQQQKEAEEKRLEEEQQREKEAEEKRVEEERQKEEIQTTNLLEKSLEFNKSVSDLIPKRQREESARVEVAAPVEVRVPLQVEARVEVAAPVEVEARVEVPAQVPLPAVPVAAPKMRNCKIREW